MLINIVKGLTAFLAVRTASAAMIDEKLPDYYYTALNVAEEVVGSNPAGLIFGGACIGGGAIALIHVCITKTDKYVFSKAVNGEFEENNNLLETPQDTATNALGNGEIYLVGSSGITDGSDKVTDYPLGFAAVLLIAAGIVLCNLSRAKKQGGKRASVSAA